MEYNSKFMCNQFVLKGGSSQLQKNILDLLTGIFTILTIGGNFQV